MDIKDSEYRLYFVAPKGAGSRAAVFVATGEDDAIEQALRSNVVSQVATKREDLMWLDITAKYANQGYKITVTREYVPGVLH